MHVYRKFRATSPTTIDIAMALCIVVVIIIIIIVISIIVLIAAFTTSFESVFHGGSFDCEFL